MNTLYYGDNLDILRRYIKDESVDLIYLDPPFKSDQNYNVLFAEQDGTRSAAQIKAFGDTWEWNQASAEAYQEIVAGGLEISRTMQAFRLILGDSNMLAYLAMMAPRLVELRRVLKSTGSIYLHCDPTASHYLKLIMDAVFGPRHFRNEIIWKRTSAQSNPRRWGPVHDVLLFYTQTDQFAWNPVTQQYSERHLGSKYRNSDKRGFYHLSDLTGAGRRTGDSGKPWRGYDPDALGRHWAVPREEVVQLVGAETAGKMTTQSKLDLLDSNEFIYWPSRGQGGGAGFPRFKRYLGAGLPIQDVIADVFPINSQAAERLGYPTQKPEALLDRIIRAGSNVGDVVLDPFCGCGTAVAVAERLARSWAGIDVTHLALTLIRHRLQNQFGPAIKDRYRVIGEPISLPDAEALAKADPYQFQWWALGLVGARPTEQKKGADKGIDGRLYFHDDPKGKTKQIVFSVKAGRVNVSHVRDLRGVLDRENAEIGALLALESSTQPMRSEAASAGFYEAPWGKRYPRIQILAMDELLAGNGVDYPRENVTFKKAPKVRAAKTENGKLPF